MHSLRIRHSLALIGRILLCCVFLVSAYAKITEWSASVQMMAAKGIPAASVFLATAIVIECLGGLAILTGFKAKQAALIVFLYLIPVTFLFHNFWEQGPAAQPMQLVNFLKNLAIMGGLLQLAAFGPGKFAIGKDRNEYREDTDSNRQRAETPIKTGVH